MCLYKSFLEKRSPSGFETTLLKLVRDALLLWQPDAVAKVQENWDGRILLYLAKQVASMPHSCLEVTDENKIEENQWKITHPQKKKNLVETQVPGGSELKTPISRSWDATACTARS